MSLVGQIGSSVRRVAQWALTSEEDVPFDEMQKALTATGLAQPTEEKPRALFHDPYTVQDWGGWRQRPSAMTYETLRMMSLQNTVIAAIINLRTNQLSHFSRPQQGVYDKGYRIILRDRRDNQKKMSDAQQQQASTLEAMLETTGYLLPDERPSDRDSFRHFIRKGVRDILTYDQFCFEKIRDRAQRPSRFICLPGETIRPAVADVEHMDPAQRRERVSHVQVYENTVIAEFGVDDLAWCIMNPRSDLRSNSFGFSPVEQIVRLVTAWLFGFEYNTRFFTQGSAVKGLLNIKGAIPDRQLRAFRRMWYTMVSGVQNCLDGSSQIWTKQGCKTIGELLDPGEVERNISVWTGDRWASARVYKTGRKSLCKMRLGNGVETLCSPEHRFRVLSGAELCWKRWDQLNVGDYVAVNAREVQQKKVPSFKGKQLTPDVCEVLGWSIGDGTLDSKGKRNILRLFYNSASEQAILERHVSILQRWGLPAEAKEKRLTREEADQLCEKYGFRSVQRKRVWGQLCNVEFVKWLLKIGFTTSSEGKSIPALIHVLPHAHKVAFLRGLFSADGNLAKHRDPCLSIMDDKLREEVKLLLLSLGIRTCLSEGRAHIQIIGAERKYVLGRSCLRVKDRDRFLQLIGFLQKHKQPIQLKRKIEGGKNDRIPLETSMALAKWIRENRKTKPKGKRERDLLNAVVCGCDTCSKPRLLRFIKEAGLKPPDWFLAYHFEPVVSLERTKEKRVMYDLAVDTEEHQFMVNGVASHNSWKTPILNSDDIQWVNMHVANREMEYGAWMDWLTKLICAIYGIDPTEINFIFGNSGQKGSLGQSRPNKDEVTESKDKGLVPLAEHVADCVNQHLIWEQAPDLELSFTGLDAKAESKERARRKDEVESWRTVNEIREEQDQESLEHGDIILNPVYLQYIQGKEGQAEGGDGDFGVGESDGSEDEYGDQFGGEDKDEENDDADGDEGEQGEGLERSQRDLKFKAMMLEKTMRERNERLRKAKDTQVIEIDI